MLKKFKSIVLPSTLSLFFFSLCFLNTNSFAVAIESMPFIQPPSAQQLPQLKARRDLLLLQLRVINQQIDQLSLQPVLNSSSMMVGSNPGNTNLVWHQVVNGLLPVNAVMVSDLSGKNFFICHIPYTKPAQDNMPSKSGIHPGLWTNSGCMITYGGKVIISQTHAEVLTGQSANLMWVSPDKINSNLANMNGNMNSNNYSPVYGGEEDGHPIFICRSLIGNTAYIGKLSMGYCNVAVNNVESTSTVYQVLATH